MQTRYYDPEVGRFISQDSIEYADPESINGLNLYAYCSNNPVMFSDPTGTTKWWEWLLLGVAAVVVIGAAVVATVATGGLALVAGGIAIGGALGGLASIVGQGVTNGWDNISVGGIAGGMLLGSALGGLGAGALGGAGVGAGVLALAGGGTVSTGVAVAGVGALALNVLFARIGNSGGYRIDHHYPNDHEPTHVHISGDDGFTKVDLNGNPIQGNRPMTPGERKAFNKLYQKILKSLLPWIK